MAEIDAPSVLHQLARLLRPVRVRITLAATLVTALALVTASWLMIRSIEGTQLAQIRDEADDDLNDLADQLAAGETELGIGLDSKIRRLMLIDENGEVLLTFPDDVEPRSGAPTLNDGLALGSEGPGLVLRTSVLGESEQVNRMVDTPAGELTLVAELPTDEVSNSIDAVRRALLLGLPALVGLVGLSTWWLVGRSLRPVEAIRAEAASIGGGTIHRRVPEPPTDDEIGRLARTMNAMLGRLDSSARRQRQFVSDASHELRSPVTAIRADLEVALREGEGADWPSVARDVLVEEGRLEQLLGDLLILAADDERDGSAPDVESALSVAAADSGAGLASAGSDRGVDLVGVVVGEAERTRLVPVSAEVPDEPVRITGSRSHLTRLVSNLLDNAARHARSRVEVSVRVVGPPEHDPPRVRMIVDDDGPGIPEADRERVFDRFVRLDEARSRDEGGAGLGLAVVRSVARRHGGDARVAGAPLGGARLVVDLPAATVVCGQQ
jgi:signal transduction histidine kinase